MIGGYAIAAYGGPRFSQDLNLLLPDSRRGPSLAWLHAEGFRNRPSENVRPQFKEASTLLQEDFSIDLMFGSIVDRETHASIEEERVSARPRWAKLHLLTGSTATETR